jgi:hypothetical protein
VGEVVRLRDELAWFGDRCADGSVIDQLATVRV